jgi:hypothetical protein
MGVVVALVLMTAVLLPDNNTNDNPVPSSYLSGRHGALAAYELLERNGYSVERWERPLSELAPQAGPQTVVVFAEPYSRDEDDNAAVKKILEKGGRVLATGLNGGFLLPAGRSMPPTQFGFAACQLEPEGLDPLASSGEVWMVPSSAWQWGDPAHRVQYGCAGSPAVVEYDYGPGHVVWWASSTPMENSSIERGQNLELLLNSLGPREGRHIYWDESLHGEIRTVWSFAGGPALTVLRAGLLGLAVLVVFSFSRRSGPVRDVPAPVRATPVEFVEALGSLYRKAGASSTAVSIAWDRFRRKALKLCGMRAQGVNAEVLGRVLRRRFPHAGESLEADLASCEEAAGNEAISPREALRMVQLLTRHMNELEDAARPAQQIQGVS